MSVLRLTDVDDDSRSSRKYWDDRCENLWGKQFHGHFLDDPKIIEQMDDVNLKVIRDFLGEGNKAVLEMACGIGRYAPRILDLVSRYVGVDFAYKNVVEAKKLEPLYPNTQFFLSDMLHFETAERFDLIFMVSAMSSIEQSSKEIVDHLRTLLKPGGAIMIFEQTLYTVLWR
jgi:SAM-dependent methyltransferase